MRSFVVVVSLCSLSWSASAMAQVDETAGGQRRLGGHLFMYPQSIDSAIVETYGLGALAVAASPTAARSVGIDPRESDAIDARLRAIAAGESPQIRFPDGRPAILGVDARQVAKERTAPPVHTGIAHRVPGIGQIGGGVTHPPLVAFDAAVEALG